MFTTVPDAVVDARAAATLRRLHAGGLRCVLACDTQRTESVRRRTLRAAGVEDCFDALVLSSTVGVRKPHRLFCSAVVERARCRAEEIVFVGDTPAKDAVGPHEYGMNAVLVTTGPRPDALPSPVGVISHFTELPRYLEALDG
ncbi:HAD family hydrolase [Streptomyces niveiscabiei]|uniref:HAD family hydrolase n=1 Tax=Streptomyces TaxID=1883 RepID=UPI0006EB72A2|nr:MULTISPECIES: HAD family hydrolase [Streptomyces]